MQDFFESARPRHWCPFRHDRESHVLELVRVVFAGEEVLDHLCICAAFSERFQLLVRDVGVAA